MQLIDFHCMHVEHGSIKEHRSQVAQSNMSLFNYLSSSMALHCRRSMLTGEGQKETKRLRDTCGERQGLTLLAQERRFHPVPLMEMGLPVPSC